MTVALSTHLVAVYFRISRLHFHQLASDTEVLQSQYFVCWLRRVECDETETATFLCLFVIQDFHVLYFAILLEGFFDFISKNVTW